MEVANVIHGVNAERDSINNAFGELPRVLPQQLVKTNL